MTTKLIDIKQFGLSQYDVVNGSMACTAISMVAGIHYLRSKGKTRRCLWTEEKASEVIHLGVRLHNAWVRHHGTGISASLVSADEMANLTQFREALQLGECLFGQYGCDDLGFTLAQAVDAIHQDFLANKSKRAAAYVLTTQAHSTMLGVSRSRSPQARGEGTSHHSSGQAYRLKFTIFDSHTRDKTTGLYIKNGKAITARFADSRALLWYLSRLYDTQQKPSEAFTLHEVSLPGQTQLSTDEESVCRLSSLPSIDASAGFNVTEKAADFVSVESISSASSTSSVYSDDTQSQTGNGGGQLARRLSRLLSLTGTRRPSVTYGQGS